LGTHRFQRAVSAKYEFIGTRASPQVWGGLIPINRSLAETARWKRCVPRDFPQEVQNNEQYDPSPLLLNHRAVIIVNIQLSHFNPTRPNIGSEQEAHARRVDCATS